MRRYLLVWLGVLISLAAFAAGEKTLTFKQVSTREGLSQNTVRSILVDRRGFVWAGTLDGLNRYDGKHFVTYKPQPGNPASLSDHRINGIFEDKNGHLWIRKYDNTFSCYRIETENFIELKADGQPIPLAYNQYLETGDSAIWLWGNANGCIRINKDKQGELTTRLFASATSLPLTHSNVRFLFEDSQGVVWAGCHSGLNRITPDLSVKQFYGEENKYSFRQAIEHEGYIYFITHSGHLFIYNQQQHTFSSPIHHSARFTNGAMLGDGRLLIVTEDKGLLAFNPQTLLFEDSPFPSAVKGKLRMFTDQRGGIWIHNYTGTLWYYNAGMKTVNTLYLASGVIPAITDTERYRIFIDSQNIYWIATYGEGLFCYNPVTGELDNYKYSANGNSPASDYILSVTEDAAGNLWLGTEYAGMIKIVRENYGIRFIRPETGNTVGKNNNIKVIYEDRNENIWVGTKNGHLYRYNPRIENPACILPNINPYTITQDAKGRIWVGTKGNGIYILDSRTNRPIAHLTHLPNISNSLSHNAVYQIVCDSLQRIWVGTFGGGLNLVEEQGNRFIFKPFFQNEVGKSKIRSILADRNGSIWIGTCDGLIRFKPEELLENPQSFATYNFDPQTSKGLNCNDIKTVFEDKQGRIWIGTAGGGLNRYAMAGDEQKESFTNYTTRQGLAGDMISSLLETSDEKLWIGSESGLTRLDRKRQSFMAFHFAERTYGNHFNENACCLRRNGETLWGTLDGILLFNPAQFRQNRFVPPVIFTDFFLYDEKAEVGFPDSPLTKSISNTEHIDLNHEQNTFTIGFANLNLTEPERNRYSYLLEPYDRRWSRVSNNNMVTYKNLPPGKYTFKVKGSNGDGRWSREESTLSITVHPPFLQSGIAYAIYIALGLIALYITFRLIYKFNNLNNTLKVEKQLTDYKLHFFTNISHEFRTPLTLIRGAVENLESEHDLPIPMRQQIHLLSRNAGQLNRLIDQLLEFRKIQNNVLTLNLEKTDLIHFSKEVFNAFREMAQQKRISYHFTSNLVQPEIFIDRGKVDKILFNLLSNAFKFTPSGGCITMSVENGKTPGTCILSVKDTGIGVPKDKQHLLFSRFMQVNFSASGTGIGLSLVKEFTEVHKGKVWYENNEEQGAVFRVELPACASAYAGENFISDTPLPQAAISEESIPDEWSKTNNTMESARNVLVIDDNPDIRHFLTEELCKHFRIDTAENGKTGLEKAQQDNPDLIICDVMMPEMDGFEVTRQLKNEFETCHIPIILLTAHSTSEHQLEGVRAGADAYITKPFSLKHLVSQVYKLIEQRETLKKRFSNSLPTEEKLLSNTDKDKEFYELINRILDENLSNPNFSVDEFSELACLKRTLFYKKIKGMTGFSPNEFIKIKRMKKAAELLSNGKHTVAEVAWQVGIEDPFYFSKCFKAQFGCSPSKYISDGK